MSDFFKTKWLNNRQYVWDPIRGKHVILTPEEEVRQALLAHFVEQCKYPKGLISVEKQVSMNGLNLRYDIVVYNSNGFPRLLVECKQKGVKITQQTVRQAVMYNMKMKVPYLMLSNGQQHFIAAIDIESNRFKWLSKLPTFEELEGPK